VTAVPDDHGRLTPEQRSLRSRMAANTRWSREDGHAGTAAARRGFADRFEREVDPDGLLTPGERAKRAERARKAHMQKLALKSARARTARKQAPA
jgi:hypothetical protein